MAYYSDGGDERTPATDKKDLHSETNENDNNTNLVNTKPNIKHIKWSPENEMIMVEWCDIAQCYKWLHTRCHKKLASLHAWFTIPAIALSTISGTASFAQTSLPLDAQPYAPMAIGTINILIGISTTIQQYLKISELNELHRVSGLLWDKFSRNIRIELAKDPDERMDAGHFLKICRQEFDRLMETSPSIPENIVREFEKHFKKTTIYEKINKPEICDSLIPTDDFRNPWYNDENKQKAENDLIKTLQLKENKIKKRDDNNLKILQDFVILFKKINNRDPMESEIFDNLKDKMDIITIKNLYEQIKNNNLLFDNLEAV